MLEVQDMRLSFSRYRTLLRREWLPVLNGVSVSVQRGELVSLIGASGAGKSLLAHAVLGILPSTTKLSGSMQFEGQPLTPARQNALRGKRGFTQQHDPLGIADGIERARHLAAIAFDLKHNAVRGRVFRLAQSRGRRARRFQHRFFAEVPLGAYL